MDKQRWPALKERLAELFATKTRDEWCALMEHTDVCFAPVLTMSEAAEHPHNVARATFVEVDGVKQPAPAPRFSRTDGRDRPCRRPTPASTPARCSPTGVIGQGRAIDAPAASAAPWSHLTAEADGDARLRPRPSRRRGQLARAARWPGRRPRVTGSCSSCAPTASTARSPDDLADGETLVDRRRAETERSAADARRRTGSCGSATATPG